MGKQTAFDSTVASVSQQFATVLAAPVPFLLVVGLVAFGIWKFLSHHYSGRLSAKDDLLVLRQAQLDDYKEKLSGASPDEAKARLDALESRLDGLAPRKISDAQKEAMLPILDIEKGSHISIIRDGVVPDAGSLTQSLTRAFHEAGWVVENPVVIGVGNPPITGIAVRVPDSSNMTGAQRAVCAAFNTAKIPYDLQSGMHQVDEHMIVANILVSQPSG